MANVPTTQNLEIYRGDDETITVTVVDRSTGKPKIITGSSFFFTAKVNSSDLDSAAIIQATVSNVNDANSVIGVALIPLTHTLTAVGLGTYVYDIQWVDSGGNVKTLIKGNLKVTDDVTKRTS